MTYKPETKDIVLNNQITNINLNNFLKAKSERLSSGVYMVTAYLSDHDPLKWKLRNGALDIMSLTFVLWNESIKDAVKSDLYGGIKVMNVSNKIDELVSLINIALSSGTVSEMNFTLLKNEYEKFKGILDKVDSKKQWHNYLSPVNEDKLFRENYLSSNLSSRSIESQTISKAISRQVVKKSNQANSVSNSNNELYKHKGQNIKDDRKEKIVSYIKGKGWMSVKDISEAIPGYSLKTVQRELLELVADNVLNKKGDRRWSRYMVN